MDESGQAAPLTACQGDDDELLAARAQFAGRWHVTRMPSRRHPATLCASLEPRRAYHIVGTDRADLAESIARYERDGYLIPTGTAVLR